MALNTNKREGDKLHAEEWNELAQEVQGKQSRLNIVDALDSTSSVDVLSAKQGKVLNDKITNANTAITDVANVVKTLPVGYFYGTYDTEEELPTEITEQGYAYVGTGNPYIIYTYNTEMGWSQTDNKYSTPALETNLSTKSQIKAPTTKAVKEGIEAVDVTLARSAEDENELTAAQKYNASANINDRAAVIDYQTSAVKSLGYKVLNPALSFAEQVENVVENDVVVTDNSNTVFEIRDEFDLEGGSVTLPAGSVLKHNGGMLKNGTINVNKISIESTKPIFGENVVVTGRPLQEASPEWFTGSDADKIQRAIECFSTVRLAPRTYSIDRPIIISKSFALKGSGTGEFFASNFPNNSVSGRMSILAAADSATSHIDTILWIIGHNAPDIPTGYTPKKYYISALIDGVCFSGNRRSDGIRWSTPDGPSRPINIVNCTFTMLRHGIHVYGSTPTYSTNFGDAQISSCNFNGNVWGLWFDGNHGIGSVVIKACTLEGNHSDDYTTGGGIYTEGNNTVYGTFFMIANNIEGQPYGVVLKGEAMQLYLIGNYFEWRGYAQKNIISSSDIYKSSILLDNGAVTGADGVSFDLKNLDVIFLSKIGLNTDFTYNLENCYVKTDLIGKLGNSFLSFVDKKDNETIVQQSNIVSTFPVSSGDPIPTFQSKVFYQIDGFPSFANPYLNGYVSNNSKYVTGFTGDIPLSTTDLRLIFYARNHSTANPIIIRLGVTDNGVTTPYEIVSKNIPYTNNKLVLFNIDLKSYIEAKKTENTQSISLGVSFRGDYSIYVSRPLLVKGDYTSFVGYNLLDYTCSAAALKNPREGYIYSLGNYKRYKGNRFVDPYGFTAVSRITGSTANRPTNLVSEIDTKFRYHDTDISKDIFAIFEKSSTTSISKTVNTGRTGEIVANTLTTAKEYSLESTITSSDAIKVAFRKTNSTEHTVDGEILVSGGMFSNLPKRFIAPDSSEYPYIYCYNGRPTGSYSAKFNFYSIIVKWVDANGFTPALSRGTTAQRPTNLVSSDKGFEYIDDDLGKHIYWNGSNWVDGNGETVGLQVSDTSVLIDADGVASKTINVYHANALNVTALNPDNTSATWLTVPSTIAVGTNTLTITAAANTASNPRGAKVIIEDGTDVVIVNVVQNYSTT